MGGYINWAGQVVVAGVIAAGVAAAIDAVMTPAPRDADETETYGFPKPIFDELHRLAWGGNRAAYMSRLDTLGAPSEISFRMKLWRLLGGD